MTETGAKSTKVTINPHGVAVEVPGPYDSLDGMKAANQDRGHYYFQPEAIRFFGSMPDRRIIAGRFFLDSCQPPHGPRIVKVCAVLDGGEVETVRFPAEAPGERDELDSSEWFKSGREARKALRWLLKGAKEVEA